MTQRKLRLTPYHVIILTALLLMLPQAMNHNVVVGVDGMFHMNRFYDAMQQIRHLNFSAFQMNYGFDQSGRIVNALYGPLFNYFAGLVLLITHGWLRFQLVAGFTVELLAGLGMYRLAETTGARRYWATAAALIYMTGGIVPAWLSAQQMSAWGAALVPFALRYGVTLLKTGRVPIIPLSIAMAVIMQTHLLSAVMTAGALLPLAIATGRQHRNWQSLFVQLATAASICLLLTANVWGGLLSIYGHNQLNSPFMPLASSTNATIASTGAFVPGTAADLGLVFSCLLLAQIAITALGRTTSSLNRWISWDGAVWLLLSSNLLPWTKIIAHWPALASYLQFPSRLRVVAVPLLLAGAALSLTEHHINTTQSRWPVISAVAIAMLTWQTLGTTMALGDTWQSPKVIPNPTGVVYRDVQTMTQVKNALASADVSAALHVIGKASADYLPLPAQYADQVKRETDFAQYPTLTVPISPIAVDKSGGGADETQLNTQLAKIGRQSTGLAYQNTILLNTLPVTKRALRGGALELRWYAKRAREVQLPVVAYTQSEASLNGQMIPHAKLLAHRNKIGAVKVHQQRGENIFVLRFRQGFLMTVLITITLVSWLLMLVLYVIRLTTTHKPRVRGAHAA